METAQERTLEVLLDWHNSWLVRNRVPGEPVRHDGTQIEFWLPKRTVKKLGDHGASHCRFLVPTEIIKRYDL